MITHDEFLKRMKENNPSIKVVGIFTGISKPIQVQCSNGHTWEPVANSILRAAKKSKNATGCSICAGKKKRSHEEFINELSVINKTLEVIGAYQSVDKKVMVRCKTCRHEWSTTANSLLRGSGCLHCGFESNKEKQRKPKQQFIQEAEETNPTIELRGEYVNSHTLIPCKCKVCLHDWAISPSNLLQKKGCPNCAGHLSLSHEEFVAELRKVQPNIQLKGFYLSTATKAPCECSMCGWKWEPPLFRLLQDRGCPNCAGVPEITNEYFHAQVVGSRTDLSVLGQYTSMRDNILCKCKVCDHNWSAPAQHIWKNTSGCPACAFKRIADENRKTHDEFLLDLEKYNKDFNKIIISNKYQSSVVKLDAKCLVCDHIWHPLPPVLLRGSGCPVCNSAGFDIMKPAIFYLYEITYFGSTYWGYGISNQYEDREKTHIKNLKYKSATILSKYLYQFYDGAECLELETQVKHTLKKEGLGYNLGVDGFITECAVGLAKNRIRQLIDNSNGDLINIFNDIFE